MQFLKFCLIGVLNTAVHWGVFYGVLWVASWQSIANVIGFLAAATFSFFVNARYTFQATPTVQRYIRMIGCMAGLSFMVGLWADYAKLPPIITLVVFSGLSVSVGFVMAKWVVFRGDT